MVVAPVPLPSLHSLFEFFPTDRLELSSGFPVTHHSLSCPLIDPFFYREKEKDRKEERGRREKKQRKGNNCTAIQKYISPAS